MSPGLKRMVSRRFPVGPRAMTAFLTGRVRYSRNFPCWAIVTCCKVASAAVGIVMCGMAGTASGALVGRDGLGPDGCKALPVAKPCCNCFRHAGRQGGPRPYCYKFQCDFCRQSGEQKCLSLCWL